MGLAMQNIKVSIYDSRTNQKYEIELPNEVTCKAIISSLMRNGRIDSKDKSGKDIIYWLVKGKKDAIKRLDDGTTLKKAGIESGEQLILFYEIPAA